MEQIAQWRTACMQAISAGGERANAITLAEERRRNRELERELRRKEKALAEAAALLVLSKKTRGVSEQKRRGRMTAYLER
ncbi:hypothetical protein OU995_19590 [Roseateles sp. SL47]|uniref:hypothetical protein n=1 Tax=Roseateles sp. SL47 TaxID=2995138 RepID=UPI00226FF75C|nr:hypothetical protein [Roseateles sp. SL47]WAC71771.1 hypothetical protein OU995_19590 [Roseateles sp. SL47]